MPGFRRCSATASSSDSDLPAVTPPRLGALLAALLALTGCLRFGQPAGAPHGTYRERVEIFARLLREEDRRIFEPVLTGRAVSSPDPWIRAKAALAAGRLRSPAAAPHIVVLLHDPDPAVRRAAAFAGGISGDTRLVPQLAESLRDSDAGAASLAAEALGRLGGEAATNALLELLGREGAARAPAARALFRTPDRGRVSRLAPLARDLDPALRRASVYALSRRPIPEALPALRLGLGDTDPRIAALCARGVGLLGDREAVPALVRLAGAGDPSVAIQALAALRTLGRKDPMPAEACVAARDRTGDPNAGVATTALGALSGCRDPESDALLQHVLRQGGPRAEEALGALVSHVPDAASLVDRYLESSSLEVRLGAADAVGRLPREAAIRVAGRLLADPSARIRAAAASALPEDVPAELLVRALGDRDPAVREAALEKAAPRHDANPATASAWDRAFASQFSEKEPDYTVGALEGAAALPKGGEALLRAKADDRDAVVRGTVRRLLVARFGARREEFDEIPVETRYAFRDYERIARQSNETLFTADVETSRGRFAIALDAEAAPITVETFRELATRGFFDGTVIHRVVPDFVVQAGDPRGDGTGGPGFAIRDELDPDPYVRGTVGMALAGPDTGGSQWFVTLSPQPHLDGAYTVFGKVSSGDETLDRIEKDDRLVSFRVSAQRREPPPGFAK